MVTYYIYEKINLQRKHSEKPSTMEDNQKEDKNSHD